MSGGNMDNLKQDIIHYAKSNLVDLIGFAGRDRFINLTAAYNPFSLFPNGETVIMIGRRITRGSLRGVEEGTNLADYGMFGLSWLNDEFLAQSTYDLAQFIERCGWEAMPVLPECGSKHERTDRSGTATLPDFDYAAVACGLAEIGLNGQVLTKEFGPRQRFHMLITNARLANDPLLDEPVCDQCGLCASICPLQAIDVGQVKDQIICGKRMRIARCDENICRICSNGVHGCDNAQGMPDRTAMLCSRTCIEHLNQANAIRNHFYHAFRRRPGWGKDADGRSIPIK